MRVIQRETLVVAATTVDNILSGSAFEFTNNPAVVSCGFTASATGMFTTLQAGGNVIMEEAPPAIKATYPVVPDEMYYTFAATRGDRLKLSVRNPTAGNITLRSIFQIQEA